MALKPRPTEWLLGGYAVVVLAVSLTRVSLYPAAVWAGVAHGLILVLVLAFASAGGSRLGTSVTRDVAPMFLLLALYGSLDLLNGYGAEPTHDDTVRRWERAVFGGEISRDWWRRAPSPFWSTILHGAYFSYYWIVPAPVALFLRRRDPIALQRATFAIVASFVICYVWFIFFPVAGPYYEYPRPDAWFTDNAPARAVYAVLSRGSSYGAAFPSSHVAATLAAAHATWLAARDWGASLLLVAGLLTVGTVYCQMHYAIDAVAGVIVAAIATAIATRLYPTSHRNARDS